MLGNIEQGSIQARFRVSENELEYLKDIFDEDSSWCPEEGKRQSLREETGCFRVKGSGRVKTYQGLRFRYNNGCKFSRKPQIRGHHRFGREGSMKSFFVEKNRIKSDRQDKTQVPKRKKVVLTITFTNKGLRTSFRRIRCWKNEEWEGLMSFFYTEENQNVRVINLIGKI